jgi:hypothetical protein
MSYDLVKDRTPATVGTEQEGGILFDETIAAYRHRRKTAEGFLISSLIDSHHRAFKPYLHRPRWTTISEDATGKCATTPKKMSRLLTERKC